MSDIKVGDLVKVVKYNGPAYFAEKIIGKVGRVLDISQGFIFAGYFDSPKKKDSWMFDMESDVLEVVTK